MPDGLTTNLPLPATPSTTIQPESLSVGIRLTDWSIHRADRNQRRRSLLLKALDTVGIGFRLLTQREPGR